MLLVSLNGCFLHSTYGPGYRVSLEVENLLPAKVEDMKSVELLLLKEGFTKKNNTSSDHLDCTHYFMPGQESAGQNSTGILCSICIHRKTNKSKHVVSVVVHNNYEGQKPALRQDIDRVSNLIFEALETQFGKGNVVIERHRT